MVLSENINNLEKDKFTLNSEGDTAVRTVTELDNVDINIRAPTGPFEISVVSVSDVAGDPLPIPLPARVSISIRNLSSSSTIYFGKDALVTADNAATGGWDIGPQEDFNVDLDDTQSFYLIAATGQSATVKILEIASQ